MKKYGGGAENDLRTHPRDNKEQMARENYTLRIFIISFTKE
jgi:hypothetical protein